MLTEWALTRFVDETESVVAELVANAVEAHRREHLDEPVRLTLLASPNEVMVVVRDASDHPPLRAAPDLNEETGRGLLIVEALSRWDWKQLPGGGKVIRSLIEGDPRA